MMNLKEIKQILVDQRQELKDSFKNKKIIEREFLSEYKKLLASGLIKIITGPRRSGKSVLGYQLLADKSFAYVNFDDERLAYLKTGELNLVLEAIYETFQKPDFILLDEIQNILGWELFLNRLKRIGFNLIVTGSNARMLGRELATHLTGRHFALELYPFSFREYLDFHNLDYQKKYFTTQETASIKRHLDNYLLSGGFPEVVQGEDYKKYLTSLYSTILSKDIVLRYKLKYFNTLREFASYLVSNFSRKVTFNKLKNIFSLKSVHTAKNYFSFLYEVYLIFQIERFSYKPKERLTAPRKIYTVDTGMINAISTKFSQEKGYLYENVVAVELIRRKFWRSRDEIYYWQDNNHYETDFLIKDGTGVQQLIQVCYNLEDYDTKKREIFSLLKASEKTKCHRLLVITSDYEGEEKIKGKKIKFIPCWKWLLGKDKE
ncbi:MAG: ATP-binding protein [Elusimicrobiota bacterium]